jgi:hypothetical protein
LDATYDIPPSLSPHAVVGCPIIELVCPFPPVSRKFSKTSPCSTAQGPAGPTYGRYIAFQPSLFFAPTDRQPEAAVSQPYHDHRWRFCPQLMQIQRGRLSRLSTPSRDASEVGKTYPLPQSPVLKRTSLRHMIGEPDAVVSHQTMIFMWRSCRIIKAERPEQKHNRVL